MSKKDLKERSKRIRRKLKRVRENNESSNEKRIRELKKENRRLRQRQKKLKFGAAALHFVTENFTKSKKDVDQFLDMVDPPKENQSIDEYGEYLQEKVEEFKKPDHGLSADQILGEKNKKLATKVLNS